jgi:hypothetical protein
MTILGVITFLLAMIIWLSNDIAIVICLDDNIDIIIGRCKYWLDDSINIIILLDPNSNVIACMDEKH